MSRPHPFLELLRARLAEFLREPEVVFWVFGFPILLAVGLGLAFRERPPESVPVAVVADEAGRELAQRLAAAPGIKAELVDAAEAERQLRVGKAALVVAAGPPLEFRFDPTRPESATARLLVDDALQRAAGRTDVLAPRNAHVTAPGQRYIDFLIPGLLGMNIMSGGMWGVGYALVDFRIRKLLKRFVATPMRRSHFLGALMASRMILVIGELVLLLAFGALVFGMPIRGSWTAIAFVSLLGGFAFSGIGLLVASRAQKGETVSGLMNLVMLPMFVFSGVFFSAERFPAALQPLIAVLPLTALNDALRGLVLDGSSLAGQAFPVAVLALWGGLSFALALRMFRWT